MQHDVTALNSCPELPSSCPDGCRAGLASRFDTARNCLVDPEEVVTCRAPQDTTFDISCGLRSTDGVPFFGSGSIVGILGSCPAGAAERWMQAGVCGPEGDAGNDAASDAGPDSGFPCPITLTRVRCASACDVVAKQQTFERDPKEVGCGGNAMVGCFVELSTGDFYATPTTSTGGYPEVAERFRECTTSEYDLAFGIESDDAGAAAP